VALKLDLESYCNRPLGDPVHRLRRGAALARRPLVNAKFADIRRRKVVGCNAFSSIVNLRFVMYSPASAEADCGMETERSLKRAQPKR
jgi:hypothetical protein